MLKNIRNIRFNESNPQLINLTENRWMLLCLSFAIYLYLFLFDKFSFVVFMVSLVCGVVYLISMISISVKGKSLENIFIFIYITVPFIVFHFHKEESFLLELVNLFGGIVLVLSTFFVVRGILYDFLKIK